MALYTANSNAGGDGATYWDVAADWGAAKVVTTGNSQPATDPCNVYTGNLGGGSTRSISRIHLPFDTSTLSTVLGSGIITMATITINVTFVSGASTFHIVQSTEASPTSLVDADFSAVPGYNSTMTSFGSLAISTNGSKIITLNSSGLLNINPSGYSKFALVEDHDVTNTDPGAASDFRIAVNMADNGTPANRPLLTVTYGSSGIINFEI